MQYIKDTFLIILIGILMTPIMLSAAPHEPSPAGGSWLELNPKLGQVQTDAPWFRNSPECLQLKRGST